MSDDELASSGCAKACTSLSARGFDIFTAWKEYEAVAMHFNDLLLRIRSQSLAAVATFATAASVFLRGDAGSGSFHWGALAAVFGALAVFWIAIWILDFAYYNLLLIGAVNALTSIERTSAQDNFVSQITLSSEIEKAVSSGSKESFSVAKGRWCFYILVFLVLLSGFVVSSWQFKAHRDDALYTSMRMVSPLPTP